MLNVSSPRIYVSGASLNLSGFCRLFHLKMPLKKVKTPGWAAFDLKQQQERGLFSAVDIDPYPPMPITVSSLRPCENWMRTNGSSSRSFSSVLPSSTNFPTLLENKDCGKVLQAGDSSGKPNCEVIVDVLAHKKLKGIHCWADDGLIEDVLASTNNHIDKASNLLKAMGSTSTQSSKENNEPHVVEQIHCFDNFKPDKDINACASLGDVTCFSELTSTLKECVKDHDKELIEGYASPGENSSYDAADAKVSLRNLRAIPVEPEWVDNDIDMYMSHRKDAIKMMRLAAHHSRTATSAYQRGDHFAAKQHSLKAREERLAAERLNSKAAMEILGIRNSQNDLWKLDLHGLHAAEAVQALQGRLLKIETQIPMNRSVSPNKLKTNNKIKRSASLESFSGLDLERLEKPQAPPRHQQMTLQVITGIGNHSQGQAALPIAVKSFLSENRYCFDEIWPGVLTVRPKFHRR